MALPSALRRVEEERGRTRQGAKRYADLKARRYALIDLEAADQNPFRADFEHHVRILVSENVASLQTDRFRLLCRAFLAEAAERFPWAAPQPPTRRVSMSAAREDFARHAARLFSMVHELHKAGYQRIRISPGISPSGMHWRCPITFAANVEVDGFTIRDYDMEGVSVALYSSADGAAYFGWKGAETMSARALAVRFLESYPRIADAGAGRDWMYAGWLAEVLGQAEQGSADDIPKFYADFPSELRPSAIWAPPPPPLTPSPGSLV